MAFYRSMADLLCHRHFFSCKDNTLNVWINNNNSSNSSSGSVQFTLRSPSRIAWHRLTLPCCYTYRHSSHTDVHSRGGSGWFSLLLSYLLEQVHSSRSCSLATLFCLYFSVYFAPVPDFWPHEAFAVSMQIICTVVGNL